MTKDQIEARIKAEYTKHHAAGLDWAKIAAVKINKTIELEREEARALRRANRLRALTWGAIAAITVALWGWVFSILI